MTRPNTAGFAKEMSKFRKHSIEEKRRRSKLRKARKKKAKNALQRGGDPTILKEGTELNVGKAVAIHHDPKEEEEVKSSQETSAVQ